MKTTAAIRETASVQEMMQRVLALATPKYIRPNDDDLRARYGITISSFIRAQKSGLLPPCRVLNGIRLVDVAATDAAIAKLPTTTTHLEVAQ